MVPWELAERVLDSLTSTCRGQLGDTLERPLSYALTPECRTEVVMVLKRQGRLAQGEAPPRGPKGDGQHAKSVPVSDERIETESPPAGAQTAHPATIVLSFVMCALVMFAAIGYHVSGGGGLNGRQSTRHDKRIHKKKQDRQRERGKKRR